jgi:eukaryotic-like serine/threonine-protein kinase
VATLATDVTQAARIPDGYQLDRLVAFGGTASVFRATDLRTGRAVAIKVFGPQGSSRIESELEILRRLAHPGIPGVLAWDHNESRCIVMDWAAGKTLREMIDAGNELSVERYLTLMYKVCDVLGHVHELGIAHLDLKPEHIVVDVEDDIKIIDFGAARPARSLLSLLMPAKRTGTPDYASPEQIKGKSSGIRSDVYSVGLIFYEMLAGELPFSGVAPDIALNLRLHRDAVPLREIDAGIPEQLSDIVQRAIQRDPAGRHANARELSLQLDQFRQAYAAQLMELLD